MLETGFLAGLVAKLAGLGSAAKVAIAGTTAALTLTVAGGAAGVLPVPGGSGGTGATQGATDQGAVVVDVTTPTPSVETGAQTDSGSSPTTAPAGSISANADAAADVTPPAAVSTTPTIPGPSLPAGVRPDLSALKEIPAQVMTCLEPVFDLVTGLPGVSPTQIRQIGSTVVTCVSGIVANVPLPMALDACISQIMTLVGDLSSQLPTGTVDFGDLDVASCIPAGLPVPTGMPSWMGFVGGGFPFNR